MNVVRITTFTLMCCTDERVPYNNLYTCSCLMFSILFIPEHCKIVSMACTTHYYQVRDTVRIYLQNTSVVSLRMDHIPLYNTSTQFVQDNSSKTIILLMYNNLVLRWLYRTRTLQHINVKVVARNKCTVQHISIKVATGNMYTVQQIRIDVVIRNTFICRTHQYMYKGCYTDHVHLYNTLV